MSARTKKSAKGSSRRIQGRKKNTFIPTHRQIIEAQRLICRMQRHGKLYATSVRMAVRILEKRIRSLTHHLGRTQRQLQTTLDQGFRDLLSSHEVIIEGRGFILTA